VSHIHHFVTYVLCLGAGGTAESWSPICYLSTLWAHKVFTLRTGGALSLDKGLATAGTLLFL